MRNKFPLDWIILIENDESLDFHKFADVMCVVHDWMGVLY